MGGRIWVESEPRRGSRFHFTVQLQIATEPLAAAPAPASAPRPRRARRPLRLLVAEDNPINREMITAVLRNLGHSVAVVTTGHQVLGAIAQEKFDGVLMDVQMPELDGIETAREIRRREAERSSGSTEAAHLPIIALTAHAMKGDREQCLAAGMDDYVPKPVRRSELLAALDRLLPADPSELPAPPIGSGPLFQREGLLAELNGDEAALRRLITLFLETTPPLLAQMRSALASGDRGAMETAAHTLKGSLLQLGEDHARGLALQLERQADNADNGGWETAPALVAELESEIAKFSTELRQHLAPMPVASA
jgi:CheY-like chemotaxis protein/HPt (histidine-containing phosphotransfer) domain-containing protein